MKTYLWPLALSLLCFVSVAGAEPVGFDAHYQDHFSSPNNRWKGADGAYSVPLLPNHLGAPCSLWLFSDTLVDDGNKSVTMFHNSYALEDDRGFHFYIKELFHPDGKGWFWLYSGLASPAPQLLGEMRTTPTNGRSRLSIFLGQFEETNGPEGFNFRFVRSWLAQAEIDPSNSKAPLQVIDSRPLPLSWAKRGHWGASIVAADEQAPGQAGYSYVFGTNDRGLEKDLLVSRVATTALIDGADHWNEWEFFDGNAFALDNSTVKGLQFVGIDGQLHQLNVSNELTVEREGSTWNLIFQNHDRVFHCQSSKPEGPYSNPEEIYRIRESAAGVITYNAKIHPQHTKNGQWLMSYNRNALPVKQVFEHPELYRPQFVRIPKP